MERENNVISRLLRNVHRPCYDETGLIKVLVITIILTTALLPLSAVLSLQVLPLPGGNLLANPWFRTTDQPIEASLDGWTTVLQNNVGWGTSHKLSNPSPDIVISNRCGNEPVYCGTAARWAEQNGVLYPNMDAYLYQVVSANPNNRKLRFMTHWVTHIMDIAEVTVYGSSSSNGPWTKVWTPFSHSQYSNPSPPDDKAELWVYTGMLEIILSNGFPYYKVEIHGRYPNPPVVAGSVGFKITGIYFTTESTTATPGPSSTPTPVGTQPPTATPPIDPRFKAYLPYIKP